MHGVGVEPGEQVVERGNQAGDEGRARQVPLPVPVGVRDEVERVRLTDSGADAAQREGLKAQKAMRRATSMRAA